MPKRQRTDDGYVEPEYPKPKAAKKELAQGTDAEGNPYYEIAPMRRVGLSKFNGKLMVNIREYYNAADGELKPGKKGITLNLDQYQAFLNIIPDLNSQLRAKGVDVDEPNMSASAVAGSQPVAKDKKKLAKTSKKANIEETSEEENEDEGVV